MTEHNVGALVVFKPGDEKIVAGIVTERGKVKFSEYFFNFVKHLN
jgi:hypothetical protein